MKAIPLDLHLAAALLDARQRSQLPQHVAAVRAGVSPVTVARAERFGTASLRTLCALARVYGVSVDDLRTRRTTGRTA